MIGSGLKENMDKDFVFHNITERNRNDIEYFLNNFLLSALYVYRY